MNQPQSGSSGQGGRRAARRTALCAIAFIGCVGLGTLTPIGVITDVSAHGVGHDSSGRDHHDGGGDRHPHKSSCDFDCGGDGHHHTGCESDCGDTEKTPNPTKESNPPPEPKAPPAPPPAPVPLPVGKVPSDCTLFTTGVMVCKTPPPGSKLLTQLKPSQSDKIAAALAGANLKRIDFYTINFNPSPTDLANANDPPIAIVPKTVATVGSGSSGSSGSTPPVTPGGATPPPSSGPPTPPIPPTSVPPVGSGLPSAGSGNPGSGSAGSGSAGSGSAGSGSAGSGSAGSGSAGSGAGGATGPGGTAPGTGASAAPAPKTGADIGASYVSLLMIAVGLMVMGVANRRGLLRRRLI